MSACDKAIDWAFAAFLGAIAIGALGGVAAGGAVFINTYDVPRRQALATITERSWDNKNERGTTCFVIDGAPLCADFLRRSLFDKTKKGDSMSVEYYVHRLTGTAEITAVSSSSPPRE